MPPRKPQISPTQKLVNNLTVADARHIVNCEGGELTIGALATEIITTAVVSATLARAIWVGDATSWHLFLPMLAQYFALLLVLPVIYLVIRHPDLRKDSIGALRLLAFLLLAGGVALGVQSYRTSAPWRQLLDDYLAVAYRWIIDAHMHWPILLAVAAIPRMHVVPVALGHVADALAPRVPVLFLHIQGDAESIVVACETADRIGRPGRARVRTHAAAGGVRVGLLGEIAGNPSPLLVKLTARPRIIRGLSGGCDRNDE